MSSEKPGFSLRKIFNSLPCRCVSAMVTGIGVVALIAGGLVLLGGTDAAPTPRTAMYTEARFPDSEQTLKEFSAQLQKETEDLGDIAPAAGGDDISGGNVSGNTGDTGDGMSHMPGVMSIAPGESTGDKQP